MHRLSSTIAVGMAAITLSGGLRTRAQSGTGAPKTKGVLDVVVSDAQGKRIAGASVAVAGYLSETGVGGLCRFSLLPGRYGVRVKMTGYQDRRVSVGIRAGQTTTASVELRKLRGAPRR